MKNLIQKVYKKLFLRKKKLKLNVISHRSLLEPKSESPETLDLNNELERLGALYFTNKIGDNHLEMLIEKNIITKSQAASIRTDYSWQQLYYQRYYRKNFW